MVTFIVRRTEAVQWIQGQLDACKQLAREDDYQSWKQTTSRILERSFSDSSIAQGFAIKSHSTMLQDGHLLRVGRDP